MATSACTASDLRFGVPARELLNIVATVQATNLSVNNEAWLYLDGRPDPVSKKNIVFSGGANQIETKAITFDPIEVKDGVVQGKVVLASPDAAITKDVMRVASELVNAGRHTAVAGRS